MKIDKVLVVDDSKVAHLTLRKMLTERGIEVDWVGSGEDSLTYLQQQRPNLIFMDVMMPGMDGFETTTAIKNGTAANLPIVMCSANTTSEDKENAAKLGAVDFLSKPYTAEELDTVLEKIRSLSEVINEPAVEPVSDAAPVVEAPSPAAAANGTDFHGAEKAAWAAADRVAREVAEQVAKKHAERAATDAAEAAARKAAQAATHAAKAHAEKSIQAATADISRTVTDEVMRSVNTVVVQKLAEQKVSGPDPSKLRGEIQRELEAHLEQQVEQAVSSAIASNTVRDKLNQLVQQRALPTVEDTARRIATQTSEDIVTESLENTGGVSKLAVVALVLSVLAVAGVAGLFAQTMM